MSSYNLPPVRHLPHWTRVGCVGKPRRLPAIQPPVVTPTDAGVGSAAKASRHGDTDPRVASLRRNIRFLQQQHDGTLEKLHAEIEHLRRENKELQYKLIMEPLKSSRKGIACSQQSMIPPTQESDVRLGLWVEEPLSNTWSSLDQATSTRDGDNSLGSAGRGRGPEVKGGLITSLQPLRIQSGPLHPPRAPTLRECEAIIRQLYNANSLQSQDVVGVKALLRDIVMNKKITPENYILTKAYLVDGTRKFSEEKELPKLGLQTFPQKSSGPPQSGVVLPALKQSLSSTVAERQRRTRAVQRSRLKRMVQ
ncbi:coiled-coil domain-containing protein 74B [Brachionichthys hirsutus]|uniref:coiled-coil domain-containing protein 74B n=1 Tax=Brachionichthys hirsutus TaxID=412623 RepID=UPI003604CE27